MKAKSRRRLLLSSVAMLLVAVLALGTATFAWFTSADSAKATNAQVKATAPAGLEICAVQAGAGTPGSGATWSDNLDLTAFLSESLEPVSFDSGVTSASFPIYQTRMTSAGVVTQITSATANTGGGTKIKNLVAIDIYGRLSGDGTKTVKFNLDLPTRRSSGNAMRCGIYSVSGTTLSNLRTYHLGANNTTTSGSDGWRTTYPLKATGSGLNINTSGENYVIPTSQTTYVGSRNYANGVGLYASQGDLSLSTNVTSTPVLLGRFLFWVDGQDPWCQNANKSGLITSGTGNFTFNFKLADAS